MNEQLDQILAILMLPLVLAVGVVISILYSLYVAWELLVYVIKSIIGYEQIGV